MKHYKHYLAPDWPAPHNVHAFHTMRHNGHSKAPYDQFNLSGSIGDDLSAVSNNRQQLHEELELKKPLHWLKQVHGTTILAIDQPQHHYTADGCFSQSQHQACIILTADCLPIFLCNQQGTEVAAIHAGWRGLLNDIIPAAVTKLSSPANQLMAWLGPAISQQHFEVGKELQVDFISKNRENSTAFNQSKRGRYFADLYKLAKISLASCGVNEVYGGGHCTYRQQDDFYSHRRDKGNTGRLASIIWLDDTKK